MAATRPHQIRSHSSSSIDLLHLPCGKTGVLAEATWGDLRQGSAAMAYWLRQPGAMRTVCLPLDKIEPPTISFLHTVAAEALEGDPEAGNVIMGYIDQALEHVLHKVGRCLWASTHFSRNTTPPVWVAQNQSAHATLCDVPGKLRPPEAPALHCNRKHG